MSYSNNYPKYDAFYKYGDSKSSSKEDDSKDIYALISAVAKKYDKQDQKPVKEEKKSSNPSLQSYQDQYNQPGFNNGYPANYQAPSKNDQPLYKDALGKLPVLNTVPISNTSSKQVSGLTSVQPKQVMTFESTPNVVTMPVHTETVQPVLTTVDQTVAKKREEDDEETKKQHNRTHKQRKSERSKTEKSKTEDDDVPELVEIKKTQVTKTVEPVKSEPEEIFSLTHVPEEVTGNVVQNHVVKTTESIKLEHDPNKNDVVSDNSAEKKVEKKSSSESVNKTQGEQQQITKKMDKDTDAQKVSDSGSESSEDFFTYEDVVLKLNCLAGAKKYQKLSISGGTLSNSKTVLDWVPVVGEGAVRYLYGEGRTQTHCIIEKIIRSAEQHSRDLVKKISAKDEKQADYESELSHLTSGLANAQMGIRNLVITYRDDDEYLAKLDNCRNKLSERFYKNMFLKL